VYLDDGRIEDELQIRVRALVFLRQNWQSGIHTGAAVHDRMARHRQLAARRVLM
jgi:hypothetical protein